MADLGLYNYIKNGYEQGKSKETIRAELAKGPATPQQIEEAFEAVRVSHLPHPAPKNSKSHDLLIGFVVILVIVFCAGYYFFAYQQAKQRAPITPATSVPTSASTQADPFAEQAAITSAINSAVVSAAAYQDSNGGIYGQDVDEECPKVIAFPTVSAFNDPPVKNAVESIIQNGSAQTTCKIYNDGDGFAISAELTADTSKWYCQDSDGFSGTTPGNTLENSNAGCSAPAQ
jgi:hypothetical protein